MTFHAIDFARYTLEQLTARPGFGVCLSLAGFLLAVKLFNLARVRIVARDSRRPLL
jgi:hypothetical protein